MTVTMLLSQYLPTWFIWPWFALISGVIGGFVGGFCIGRNLSSGSWSVVGFILAMTGSAAALCLWMCGDVLVSFDQTAQHDPFWENVVILILPLIYALFGVWASGALKTPRS